MHATIRSVHIVEIRNKDGKLCGTYHYDDPFKSFFRGLFTRSGKDVVACPPPDHPHHKGLQFGLTTSLANFWEEDKANVPRGNTLPFGKQHTTKLELLSPADGIGFSQDVLWATDKESVFNETRTISVEDTTGAYVWTWQTTLTATREVQITKSVWDVPGYCSPPFSYCGLGLRLAPDLFERGEVRPAGVMCGHAPTSVSFKGKGAEITFEQKPPQTNALFVSTYEGTQPYGPGGPGFAFMGLVPKHDFKSGESLASKYVITVSDV